MAVKGKVKAKGRGKQVRQAAAVAVTAPLDPLASAVARLNQVNYGLSLALHQQLIDRQFAHAMDDESPKQTAAWDALQEWRKIDVTTAGKTLDLLAAQMGKQDATTHVPPSRADLAAGIAALLTDAGDAEAEDRAAESAEVGPDRQGPGRRPTGTDVVVSLDDA